MNHLNIFIRHVLVVLLIGIATAGYTQTTPTDSLPPDPGALSVYNVQNLSFGAFSHGSAGGSVSISANGDRSVLGTVTPLNLGFAYYQSIFEIEAPEGSIISIMNGPDAILTGSNGGSMKLTIGTSSRGSMFLNTIPSPNRVPINFGGILSVGNITNNPPGTYTGTFFITFNQE
ncbi:MAG: DUF4402 domain-containing protein [Pedobacter sp.]|nr:MAG: DUF4402 domain-containing protein [Pedobacter sp.]